MALADQPLTLNAGSMVRYSFGDFVDAAAHARFAAITVTKRLRHLAHRRENLTDREMRDRIRDHGLRVAEIDGTPGWLGGAGTEGDRELGFEEALDLAGAVGAAGIVAYHDGRATPASRLVDLFAAACDRALERNLTVAFEFLPWTPVPALGDALAVVQGADRPNGRLVLDSWHHTHSGQRSLALTPAQARLVSCFQLVDARPPETDDLVQETMFGRRAPGTGVIDLATLVADLQAAGVDCPVAVEVYDETLVDLSAREYATTLADAARRTLAAAAA